MQALKVVQENGTQILYPEVCAKHSVGCVPPNPLLFSWQRNSSLNLSDLTFPIHGVADRLIHLAGFFGGNVLGYAAAGNRQRLVESRAMRLLYYLKTEDPEDRERSQAWLTHFLDHFNDVKSDLALEDIEVPGGWGSQGRPTRAETERPPDGSRERSLLRSEGAASQMHRYRPGLQPASVTPLSIDVNFHIRCRACLSN